MGTNQLRRFHPCRSRRGSTRAVLVALVVAIVVGWPARSSIASSTGGTPSVIHHQTHLARATPHRVTVMGQGLVSSPPGQWMVVQARQHDDEVAAQQAALQQVAAQQLAAAAAQQRAIAAQKQADIANFESAAAANSQLAAAPPVPPRYGCAAALAYLQQHAAPGYQLECPGDAQGHQAATCFNVAPICPNGGKRILIADPCPAAYMNEAANSQTISSGNLTGPWDPFGYCGQPGNPNG